MAPNAAHDAREDHRDGGTTRDTLGGFHGRGEHRRQLQAKLAKPRRWKIRLSGSFLSKRALTCK
jgi:hypothetical protein